MVYNTQEFADRVKGIIKDELRHPLYQFSVDHAEAMAVHIYGDKPMYLLERARPREDSDVKTYRIDNYEPTTKAGADKAIDIVCKIFNPDLYTINWKNQTPEIKELQQYTGEYFPVYNTIENFDKDVVLRKMLADPNGVMAIKPERPPANDAEKVKPVVVIYSSSNVWWYDLDCFLIYLSKETIDQKEYCYFAYYDRNQYIRFSAYYEPVDQTITFNEQEVYVHNFNEIPAWFLRGKSKSVGNGEICFESFFSSALPNWNLAVIHESDLLGAYITHMHPQKYELAEECNFRYPYEGTEYPCKSGIINYPGKGGTKERMDCPVCGGTGLKTVKSPYQSYLYSRQKLEEGQPSGLLPVGYITIPVEATKMLEERTREMIHKGMWAINMDVEDKVGEVQSGVAKTIDRSAQNDFLLSISTVMFDIHLTNQYYFINKYLFSIQSQSLNKKEDKNLPEINKPTKFDLLTTSERIYNFSVAQQAGVDKNYLRIKAIEIANTDLSTMPDIRRYMVVMINLDPLYGYTQDEMSLGVSSGVIRKVDWTIHENLKPFMDKAIESDEQFLNKPKQKQIEVLEKFGNELIASEEPKVEMAVLDTQMDAA